MPAVGHAQESAHNQAKAPAQTVRLAAEPRAGRKAKNVILFLADAGGVPVLHGASLLGYGEPRRLGIQQWPYLGLSETSPVDDFVSDSANGMSSIVTGVKTRNGVISQNPDAQRGRQDGTPTKTVLEYAEQRGLLTGIVTTQSIADATPAANYAHSNDRKKWGGDLPSGIQAPFWGRRRCAVWSGSPKDRRATGRCGHRLRSARPAPCPPDPRHVG